jgi:hypothetical protein
LVGTDEPAPVTTACPCGESFVEIDLADHEDDNQVAASLNIRKELP